MIVLFTHPEQVLHEQEKISEIMLAHPAVLLHIRKPAWKEHETRHLLDGIDRSVYERIVLHQHTELTGLYNLKGSHLKDSERMYTVPASVSTSVHSMNDARKHGCSYQYFFCSPVFPSISKIGYSCDENWDITGESDLFRQKAVALGGIEAVRAQELKQLGFQNYAFLGAVWYREDPVKSFTELATVFAE